VNVPPPPLDPYNMAASGSSVADTHLRTVGDDGWTTTTNTQHSISVGRPDPIPRSHFISQSRQRPANFNQAAPAFPGIRIVSLIALVINTVSQDSE
jgi:hypothetical protein